MGEGLTSNGTVSESPEEGMFQLSLEERAGAGYVVPFTALASGPPCFQLVMGRCLYRPTSQGFGKQIPSMRGGPSASLQTLGSLSKLALWLNSPGAASGPSGPGLPCTTPHGAQKAPRHRQGLWWQNGPMLS